MNEALLSHYITERRHLAARRPFAPASLAEGYAERGLDYRERMADRFALAARQEVPYIAEDEKIVFVRTVTDLPDILTPCEWAEMRARSFREALQALRILHYALWLEGEYRNDIGRFDVLMRPYYERSRAAGMSREEAYDLILDFFLSLNKDSDLYAGARQGEVGQSMVLGGQVRPLATAFCELSELCLEAVRDLGLTAPRITLRVSRETPLSVFEKATELTECGRGFLQYSNDDVIIPGLLSLGYDEWDV